MANWHEILTETNTAGSTHDIVRRKYLKKLSEKTGRNVIVYYSGWLQKSQLHNQAPLEFTIGDIDKTGFMTCIHQLDPSIGLDLLLHTPGGSTAATESLADYLRSIFGTNIRAIVPQLAMSGGTVLACACKEIIMGKHSSLGPIDPQIFGIPAHGIREEFERAKREIVADPRTIPLWQQVVAKYRPALLVEVERAIKWTESMTIELLKTGMFVGRNDSEQMANAIVNELGDHSLTLSHDRHISATKARSIGLIVSELENDNELQDAVLSVHHCCVQTLTSTSAGKIIENHKGVAYIHQFQPRIITTN